MAGRTGDDEARFGFDAWLSAAVKTPTPPRAAENVAEEIGLSREESSASRPAPLPSSSRAYWLSEPLQMMRSVPLLRSASRTIASPSLRVC